MQSVHLENSIKFTNLGALNNYGVKVMDGKTVAEGQTFIFWREAVHLQCKFHSEY